MWSSLILLWQGSQPHSGGNLGLTWHKSGWGHSFFWWFLVRVNWLLSKMFCLPRLPLSHPLARESWLLLECFLSVLIGLSELLTLQLQVWHLRGKKKTRGTHHCVILWVLDPWPVCLAHPTFLSLIMFVLYIMSKVLSCASWEEQWHTFRFLSTHWEHAYVLKEHTWHCPELI